jgi:hypothetical protein
MAEVTPTVGEAMQLLITSGYHKKNTTMTIDTLSKITLTISEDPKAEALKHIIQSIGVLLSEVGKETSRKLSKEKEVEGIAKEVREEMVKATKEQKQEWETVRRKSEESAKEARETKMTVGKIAEGMEALTSKMKMLEASIKASQSAQAQPAATKGQSTYAAATIMGTSLKNHATVIARGEDAEKQIVVGSSDKNTKEVAAGLKTERELMTKADMTIKLMAEEGMVPPIHIKFIAGLRTKTGLIIYTLNSKEATNWLKHPDRLKLFNEKYGDSAAAHAKLFNVLAFYVPTTFNSELKPARLQIEIDNDLKSNSLMHAKYIKPAHKRSAKQQSAHVVLGFATRADANAAIAKRWIVIENKRVAVKKFTAEPRRCFKCQSVKGDHTADKCT